MAHVTVHRSQTLPDPPPALVEAEERSTAKSPKESRATTCIATRAQIVALKECGVSNEDISRRTGVCRRQIQYMWAKAVSRGWQPGMRLEDAHLKDAKRPGRPKKSISNGDNPASGTLEGDAMDAVEAVLAAAEARQVAGHFADVPDADGYDGRFEVPNDG